MTQSSAGQGEAMDPGGGDSMLLPVATEATVSVGGGPQRGEPAPAADARDARRPTLDARSPRLGFLGVGWIGRNRLEAIVADGSASVVAVADASGEAVRAACAAAPGAAPMSSLEALLELDLDGLVIATPSALHADQARLALEHGLAVFCQKPLARTGEETREVIAAARDADRLLGVDLSYRHTAGMHRVRELLAAGELGDVYAVDLVFHNAYGPDKAWFRDPRLAGGGCVVDLGIHLVDLALWSLDWPAVNGVTSRLYAQGRLLGSAPAEVEDYAVAQVDLDGGAVLRLACSWNLSAGRDAVIEAAFHGTRGGASFHNVNGSFYDFVAERYEGTRRTTLAEPPDAWGGRAAVAWARQLARSHRFDPEVERLVAVARTLDAIYGR
ncbi:MAG TPA: Gfo/Idh/MocA family oxidoreductase [Gemmatimonadaceae bacterium]|nr:Gfo/Idh/MocA family oxidoreductase [Gemmatimonadaceae bacterium]